MPQKPKTREEIQSIIDNISFMDRKIRLISKGTDGRGNEFFCVQVEYLEEDIDKPGCIELQRARKWYVSPYSTETEIVETAFAACKRSMEHVLKEHFTYKEQRVYSPHFDINTRLRMCEEFDFDKRSPLFNKWEIWLLNTAKDHHKDGLTGDAAELEQIVATREVSDELSFRTALDSMLCWDKEDIDHAVREVNK